MLMDEPAALALTFHGPVVNSCLCDKCNGVQVDPLPEDDIICHLVCFHLALHLNVEDLQVLSSYSHTKMGRGRRGMERGRRERKRREGWNEGK